MATSRACQVGRLLLLVAPRRARRAPRPGRAGAPAPTPPPGRRPPSPPPAGPGPLARRRPRPARSPATSRPCVTRSRRSRPPRPPGLGDATGTGRGRRRRAPMRRPARGQHQREPVGARRQPEHRPIGPRGRARSARSSAGAGRGRRRAGAGRPTAAHHAGRRRGAQELRPGARPTATPPSRPARCRSADGPAAGDLGQRLAASSALGRLDADGDDPPADPATVQLDPHHVADPHLVAHRVGDEVVELLVDAGDVGQDPDDQRRLGRPAGGRRLQSPSADFRSPTRLVCSQVKSGSARPKWP